MADAWYGYEEERPQKVLKKLGLYRCLKVVTAKTGEAPRPSKAESAKQRQVLITATWQGRLCLAYLRTVVRCRSQIMSELLGEGSSCLW